MKMTIRGPVFETNSSSEHTFMYLSKETFEKWRRGEVRIGGGNIYPVRDLTDDYFTIPDKKPDTVCGPQMNECPEEEWFRERLDNIDNSTVKADLLYVIRKYYGGKEGSRADFEMWDGSYVSMLLTYLRHYGEYVPREDANKRYVDPEDWGPAYDELLVAFRNALCGIEGWEEINDEKYSEFREAVNGLKNKEEITEEDISAFWDIMYDMEKHEIKDEEFEAFEDAFNDLYDYDSVYQSAHMDVMDNGKKIRIHIWGRDDG